MLQPLVLARKPHSGAAGGDCLGSTRGAAQPRTANVRRWAPTSWREPVTQSLHRKCCAAMMVTQPASEVGVRRAKAALSAPPDERGGNRSVQPKATAPLSDSTKGRRTAILPAITERDS